MGLRPPIGHVGVFARGGADDPAPSPGSPGQGRVVIPEDVHVLELEPQAAPLAVELDGVVVEVAGRDPGAFEADRKSTRLNSSHLVLSYAALCLNNKSGRRCRQSRAEAYDPP